MVPEVRRELRVHSGQLPIAYTLISIVAMRQLPDGG
jgi:hypothetical protein